MLPASAWSLFLHRPLWVTVSSLPLTREPFPTEPNHPALNFCLYRETQLTLPNHPLALWSALSLEQAQASVGNTQPPSPQCRWPVYQFSHTNVSRIPVLILPPAHRSLPPLPILAGISMMTERSLPSSYNWPVVGGQQVPPMSPSPSLTHLC